ncbi:TRAP transporter large permease [Paracoccus sp. J39]|uniref:TRAP transporter large permease n=1 Tax=Paracoccus sp. J39 TaxID=935848 RepID=UPI00048A9586|nr:TRAP transporter large permease [Paracoccus sp. J39]
MATTVALGLFVLLMAVGLPVALTFLVSGGIGIYMLLGPDMIAGLLTTSPLSSVQIYALIAIPMFILMANLITVSGVTDELFDVTKIWVGRTPGGLAHATALTGAIFGAVSGSSTAAAATLASTSIPGMLKQGYNKRLATGVAAISGTLAMLIPPSVAMVFYALIADLRVSHLLIAGLVPGILVTITIILTVLVLVRMDPDHAPAGQRYSLGEKIRSLRNTWSFLLLFIVVIGAIYTGIATPTETSAIGALAALLLCLWRRVPAHKLAKAVRTSAETSCMIALIIIGASVFGYFVTLTQMTQSLIQFVADIGMSRWAVLAFAILLYVVLGCFMDMITMLILTVPIMVPLMNSLGFDPYWFAVIVIVTAELGMVTPPFGLNVFVISKYTGIPVGQIFHGSLPHVVAHLILIFLLVLFPGLITWLPSTM